MGPSPDVLYTVTVPPAATVRHEYGLYYVDACASGRFTFESTFDLTNTDPPLVEAFYRTRLGIDVIVAPGEELRLDVHEPAVAGTHPTE